MANGNPARAGGIRRWSVAVVLLALCAAAGAFGWCGLTYVRLARLQARVGDACARVEAAAHTRLGLVDNLLLLPHGGAAAVDEALASVRQARVAAGDYAFPPEILDRPADLADFRARQASLEAALAALVQENEAFGGLATRLERAESSLDDGLVAAAAGARELRDATRRFPATLLASVAAPDAGGSIIRRD
jgi:hypothetical protein